MNRDNAIDADDEGYHGVCCIYTSAFSTKTIMVLFGTLIGWIFNKYSHSTGERQIIIIQFEDFLGHLISQRLYFESSKSGKLFYWLICANQRSFIRVFPPCF